MKKTCPICNKIFKCSNKINIYCSRECYHKHIGHFVAPKICEICKKTFMVRLASERNKRFCGWECYSKYRKGMPLYKKGIYKTCEVCNNKFYVQQNRKDKAKYCSHKCSAKANLINRTIEKNFICNVCKKPFKFKTPFNVKKYCSEKCRNYAGYWLGSKTLTCIKCGKEFTINKGQQYKRKYCSNNCRIKDLRDAVLKINKRNGVKRYFERRGLLKECQECGYKEHPKILGIHHKDGNGNNHSLDNLIILCPICHSLKHKKHLINWGGS